MSVFKKVKTWYEKNYKKSDRDFAEENGCSCCGQGFLRHDGKWFSSKKDVSESKEKQ